MLGRAALLACALAAPLLSLGAAPAQAQVHLVQRCDTTMRFVNNSSNTVMQLFFNPSRIPSWGPDRLGANVLRPGQSFTMRLAHEEPYDFRIVWDNGGASEMRHTEICRISRIVVTNDGLRPW